MIYKLNKEYTFWDRKKQQYISIVPIAAGDTHMEVVVMPGNTRALIAIDHFDDTERFLLCGDGDDS